MLMRVRTGLREAHGVRREVFPQAWEWVLAQRPHTSMRAVGGSGANHHDRWRPERMADRVAVVGAGQMGNGIAHVFAQSGFDVTMIDVSPDALKRGRDTIASNLDRQIKKGSLQAADKDTILG